MSAFAGVDPSHLLVTAMKTAAMNHRVIAQNIANADTPNYNPVSLDFQETLRAALEGRDRVSLRKTQARHLEATRMTVGLERIANGSKNDYNKVDLEREVLNLAENTSRYTTYGSLLKKRFDQMKRMLEGVR